MQLQLQVGPQIVQDGVPATMRGGKSAEAIVTELNGRYYEQVYRGNTFTAATQAGVAITNLATTATGFILSNPAGSGKNLVLLEIALAQTSTAAAAANAAIVLAANINPVATAVVHTTPLTIQPALLGGTAGSVAKADSAATLPVAPSVVRVLWQPSVSATATTAIPPYVKDEVAGALAIAPGCAVSLSAFSAVSAIAHFTWAELPI
jgi:hypothetical protein